MQNKIKVNILGRGKFFGYKVPSYNVYIDRSLYNLFIKQRFHGITIIPVHEEHNNSKESVKDSKRSYTEAEMDNFLEYAKQEKIHDNIKEFSKNNIENTNIIENKSTELSDIPNIDAEIQESINNSQHQIINNTIDYGKENGNTLDYNKKYYSEEELRSGKYQKEDLANILCHRGHNWSVKKGKTKDPYIPKHRDTFDDLLNKVLKTNDQE